MGQCINDLGRIKEGDRSIVEDVAWTREEFKVIIGLRNSGTNITQSVYPKA